MDKLQMIFKLKDQISRFIAFIYFKSVLFMNIFFYINIVVEFSHA